MPDLSASTYGRLKAADPAAATALAATALVEILGIGQRTHHGELF